jgi:hypothetical protein
MSHDPAFRKGADIACELRCGREKKIEKLTAETRRNAEGRREKPSHSTVYSTPVCNQKITTVGQQRFFLTTSASAVRLE